MSAVESVCPPPEELEVKGVAVCPVEGCEREFPSSSHLQMHVARHHEGRKLRGRGGKRLAFYCPVEECERREGGGKPFPRLGELKQVYIITSIFGRLAKRNSVPCVPRYSGTLQAQAYFCMTSWYVLSDVHMYSTFRLCTEVGNLCAGGVASGLDWGMHAGDTKQSAGRHSPVAHVQKNFAHAMLSTSTQKGNTAPSPQVPGASQPNRTVDVHPSLLSPLS